MPRNPESSREDLPVRQKGSAKRFAMGLALAPALWLAPPASIAAGAPLHQGVASCAGSACHGATRPFAGIGITQGEYLVWQRHDPHARAYLSLRGEPARRITAKLGLGPAWEAQDCIACHADAPPPAQRARAHQLSDGVGCEACHGGAGPWLRTHTKGYASLAQRKADGLYPTWEPAARAQLCLSCHQGDAARPMTHRIMGAGHPPLRFELDTFTAVMPPHHVQDADYAARKGAADAARNWVEGQVAAAGSQLRTLALASAPGRFPELAHYDCGACHHSLQAPRWEAGLAGPLPPGAIRLHDTPMRLLGMWLGALDPALAARWREALGALHAASHDSDSALQARANELLALLDGTVVARLRDDGLRREKLLAGLGALLAAHARGPAGADFSSAEQLAMASAVLYTALAEQGRARVTPEWRAALDQLYGAVRDRDRFDPAALRRAIAQAEAALAPAANRGAGKSPER